MTIASDAGFTPGPWQVVDNRSLNGAYWICAPDEFTSHAEVRAGCVEAEELGDPLANARLIASAPALYGQHEANLADLWVLRKAIEEGDPKAELLLRIDDLERHTNATLAQVQKASTDQPSKEK